MKSNLDLIWSSTFLAKKKKVLSDGEVFRKAVMTGASTVLKAEKSSKDLISTLWLDDCQLCPVSWPIS